MDEQAVFFRLIRNRTTFLQEDKAGWGAQKFGRLVCFFGSALWAVSHERQSIPCYSRPIAHSSRPKPHKEKSL